jgi:hypothetical protein
MYKGINDAIRVQEALDLSSQARSDYSHFLISYCGIQDNDIGYLASETQYDHVGLLVQADSVNMIQNSVKDRRGTVDAVFSSTIVSGYLKKKYKKPVSVQIVKATFQTEVIEFFVVESGLTKEEKQQEIPLISHCAFRQVQSENNKLIKTIKTYLNNGYTYEESGVNQHERLENSSKKGVTVAYFRNQNRPVQKIELLTEGFFDIQSMLVDK